MFFLINIFNCENSFKFYNLKLIEKIALLNDIFDIYIL